MRHFSWGGQTKASTSRSQITLSTHLGMPGLSNSLPAIRSNSPTRWLTYLTYGHSILVSKHYWCCSFTWCLSSWATLQEENPATLQEFGSRPSAVEVSPTTSSCYHSTSCISSSSFPARKIMFDLPMTVVGRLLPYWNLTTSKISLRELAGFTEKMQCKQHVWKK